MKILILTQYYDPEPEPIPHQMAKGMVERGHTVTVITGFPNYPYGRIFQGYKQHLWRWERIDGVKVLRLPSYFDHSQSAIRRFSSYLSLALSASIIGPALCGSPDIIFVYHPISLGIPARWIGLLHRAPFVLNIQDMYPESLKATSLASHNFAVSAVGRFTEFIYGRAAAIAAISQGFKKNLLRKGVQEEKIHIILNWADGKTYYPAARDESLAKKFGMAGRFNVVYAGMMGPAQGLLNVIEAASMLTEIPDIQFVLVGDGLDKPHLEKAVRERNLQNVLFVPRQPSTNMPFFYALSDALLVHLTDDPLFEITVPSKTQSYLACGRPIIMSLKGDATNLVLEAEAGIACRPSDPIDLAHAVKKLYAMSPAEQLAMGNAGREYFLKNLQMDIALNKYEALFKAVVGSTKHGKGSYAVTQKNGARVS